MSSTDNKRYPSARLIVDLLASSFSMPAAAFIEYKNNEYKLLYSRDIKDIANDDLLISKVQNSDDYYIVNDAVKDNELSTSSWVSNAPYIRFFAGYKTAVPRDNRSIIICVLDSRPHTLSESQIAAWNTIRKLTSSLLEPGLAAISSDMDKPAAASPDETLDKLTAELDKTKQTLAETEQRLKTVITSSSMLLITINKQGIISFCEGNVLKSIDVNSSSLVGHSLNEYDYLNVITNPMQSALTGKTASTLLNIGKLNLKARCIPLLSVENKIYGAICTATDVSDLIRTEHELEQKNEELLAQQAELRERQHQLEIASEDLKYANLIADNTANRFRELFQEVPVACCSFDKTGAVLEWNHAFEALMGCNAANIIQKPYKSFFGPAGKTATFNEALSELFKGRPLAKSRARIKRPDNSIKYVVYNAFPLYGIDGQIIGGISSLTDITEMEQMRFQLAEHRSFLKTVIDCLPNVVFVLNKNLTYTLVNNAFATAINRKVEDIIGKHISDILPNDENTKKIIEMNKEIMRTKTDHHIDEMTITDGYGETRWIESFKHPFTNNDGTAEYLLGVTIDITERKKVEEELRIAKEAAESANVAKSRFLATMSHELRTPLNAIIGFSEVLQDFTYGVLNTKQAKYVEHILTSGRHLLQLINDILDLAKIEAGRLELDCSYFNPQTSIEDIINIVKTLASKKQIQIITTFHEALPQIFADQAKYKQILYNLLSNAIKFTPNEGSITITAEACEDQLRISVRDTGIGIKESDIGRIFKEFEQLDASYARNQEGTGLGLALTKKLIDMHEGKIWVNSAGEGSGSTFSFMLPIKDDQDKEDACPNVDEILAELQRNNRSNDLFERLTQQETSSKTILVVEDNISTAELIAVYLTDAGYQVHQANTCDDALNWLKENRPYAITLDIRLPKMNGWELLTQIRRLPDMKNIPVVVISIIKNHPEAQQYNVLDCLTKPVDKRKLLKVIANADSYNPGSKTILVVDDQPMNVELLSSSLQSKGFNVLEAFGGEEAIHIAQTKYPDLIILDLRMPGTDGFDVIHELKQQADTKDIPIIVNTAEDITPELRKRLGGDVTGLVSKVTKDVLLDRLSGWKTNK